MLPPVKLVQVQFLSETDAEKRDLAPSGIHHEQGLWVYGDYKSVAEAKSPIECAKACEADEGCLHWNFHVVHHHCDLKTESSGHNEGVPDWISGNAMRYASRLQTKRPEREL